MKLIVNIAVWVLSAAFFFSGCFGVFVSSVAYRVFRRDQDTAGIMMVLMSFLCDAVFLFVAAMLALAAVR